jgi:hypothetical protein
MRGQRAEWFFFGEEDSGQRMTHDAVGEQCVCLGGGMESSRFSVHWLGNMLVSNENQPPFMGQALQAHEN